ncbi:MAG TPA: hypothetical protein PLY23_09015 [Alphaproteobacteria bacterium]|nr:hypothetical protein [Alphaproteobacteria bacterium]HQS94747.1 hypothetical protein [Alphaproteobacteria bacterium]
MKLYKKIDGKTYYWETWEQDKKFAYVHWGVVGEHGETKEIKSTSFLNFRDKVQKEINTTLKKGYEEFDSDDLVPLIIEYKTDNLKNIEEDISKRYSLEDRMQETLAWTGLGHCDGGSIGSGTMEVCCYVVDFIIAKKVIEKDLNETPFHDYTRIYNEDDE